MCEFNSCSWPGGVLLHDAEGHVADAQFDGNNSEDVGDLDNTLEPVCGNSDCVPKRLVPGMLGTIRGWASTGRKCRGKGGAGAGG